MPDICAEIITIGDELLYGQTVDTNSAWIGQQLSILGISLNKITTISDNGPAIHQAIQQAEGSAQVILITGGLGPTNDDITKRTLADYFGVEMLLNESVIDDLKILFKDRPYVKVEDNLVQATIPANCTKLTNKLGTAPGMWFYENNTIYVSMPGVPREMKHLMEEQVLPKIKETLKLPVIVHSMVHTIGIAEIRLSELLQDIEQQLPNHISLAYLPSLGMVKLRLTAKGKEKQELEKDLAIFTRQITEIASEYIFGYGDTTLESEIGKILTEKELTISTAESCSGGKLANTITSVPGSSNYFNASIIAYSYDAKSNLLGVSMDLLNEVGAVSEEVAIEMAKGVRERLGTDIGVSSTGIAGPGGGTPDKPVGTVWIAYADAHQAKAKKLTLGDTGRLSNITLTTKACLNLIRKMATDSATN